jgi:hypothetical protein
MGGRALLLGRRIFVFAFCLWGVAATAREALSFASEPSLAMPPGASFTIGSDGNFLVNGKPRFLIGNLYYIGYGRGELVHGPGYAPQFSWIYETPPCRAYLQRLGFDSSGGEASATWLAKYRAPAKTYYVRNAVHWDVMSSVWQSGLPMIADFTCAKWSHGGMKFSKKMLPAESAFVEGGHFMPYSLVTPEGRALWREMWQSGAEEFKAHGAKPYVYELFNEPRYDDRSPAARRLFAKSLSHDWNGAVTAMNEAWGTSYGSFEEAAAFKEPGESIPLHVAWMKFREACFVSGVKLGVETIRAVDPSARFCFQPLGRFSDLVTVFGGYRHCEVTMTPTGGGTRYEDMILRAISDGKPIIDGETYLGRTRTSHRAKLVREWARGLNASYYFKWERRMGEVDPTNGMASLVRLGEKFPWMGLNPAFVSPGDLSGILDAKRDIFAMQDVFAPRQRGLPAAERVAVFVSLANERLGLASGHLCRSFSRAVSEAMADAHLPLDAVLEEQLTEGRHDRYRFMVAAGIEAVGNRTPERLMKWVEKGGTLVLTQEMMDGDEWGRKRENGWGLSLGKKIKPHPGRVVFDGMAYDVVPYRRIDADERWAVAARLADGSPAILKRVVGKGRLYYVGVRFIDPAGEGELMRALAAKSGIAPWCSVEDPETGKSIEEIETFAARRADGTVGFTVENRTLLPRVVRFRPGGRFKAAVLADVTRRMILGRDREGGVTLFLAPGDPVVLRGAPNEKALRDALGTLKRETYEKACKEAPQWLAAHRPEYARMQPGVSTAVFCEEGPLSLDRLRPLATKGAVSVVRDGGVELAVTDETESWCALHLRLRNHLPLDAVRNEEAIVFEVNAGRTPLGRRGKGGQRLRVALQFRDADGKELPRAHVNKPRIEGGRIDSDPQTWQRVCVPFSSNVPQGAAKLDRVIVQLCDLPQDGRNGLVVRGFRLGAGDGKSR